MIKAYKLRVSYGDGKPIEATINAKNGQAAQDAAIKQFPGVRSVYVLGVETLPEPEPPPELPIQRPDLVVQPKAKPRVDPRRQPHPLFTDVTRGEVSDMIAKSDVHRYKQIQHVITLYGKGLTHRQIAAQIGVGRTTVGTWLKQYGS